MDISSIPDEFSECMHDALMEYISDDIASGGGSVDEQKAKVVMAEYFLCIAESVMDILLDALESNDELNNFVNDVGNGLLESIERNNVLFNMTAGTLNKLGLDFNDNLGAVVKREAVPFSELPDNIKAVVAEQMGMTVEHIVSSGLADKIGVSAVDGAGNFVDLSDGVSDGFEVRRSHTISLVDDTDDAVEGNAVSPDVDSILGYFDSENS